MTSTWAWADGCTRIGVKPACSNPDAQATQLYVRYPQSKVARPTRELKGFQRINLKPDEKKTVQISLRAASLAWWNEKEHRFEIEAEPVRILIGSSSADIKLEKTVSVQ